MAKDRLVEIVSSGPDFESLEDEIKRALEKALNIMNVSGFVEVSLLNTEEIAKINETYRDKSGPTNVLSIPDPEDMPEGKGELNHLGEIYLCPEIIKEREEDIIFLAVHGLLHLCGYTHSGKSDTMEMERLEDELMKKLKEN